jgi:secretion/DNA translocation related CpaE-like protein
MAGRIASASPSRPQPLVITDDAHLLDELLDIAESAGVEVHVAPDAAAARQRFAAAPLVLVDAAGAVGCAREGLPRRPNVVVVTAVQGSAAEDPPPGSPVRAPDEPAWAVAQALGAEHIAVLPAARPWLHDRLVHVTGPREGGRVVAVVGGRGGAGASVLAAGLAVTAARGGLRALLVDADPLGGGVDLVLGWEALDGLRWPALTRSRTDGLAGLVAALPGNGELAALSWDRGELLDVPVEAMAAALDAGRAERELVVVDLPRRLDDAAVVALGTADLVLLVVPAELRACAAAARVVTTVAPHACTIRLIVRGPAPGRLRAREISRALGLPLGGTLRAEPDLAKALERGEPPAGTGKGPLAALCLRLIGELDLVNRSIPA